MPRDPSESGTGRAIIPELAGAFAVLTAILGSVLTVVLIHGPILFLAATELFLLVIGAAGFHLRHLNKRGLINKPIADLSESDRKIALVLSGCTVLSAAFYMLSVSDVSLLLTIETIMAAIAISFLLVAKKPKLRKPESAQGGE